jgi:hypothetical protein
LVLPWRFKKNTKLFLGLQQCCAVLFDFAKNRQYWGLPKPQNERTRWFWVFQNSQTIYGFHERTSGPFSVLFRFFDS